MIIRPDRQRVRRSDIRPYATVHQSPGSSGPAVRLLLLIRPPPGSPLFPYTTLFRSRVSTLTLDSACASFSRVHGQPHLRSPASRDRKSTRLNSSHVASSYPVVCLKKKIDGYSEHHDGASSHRCRNGGMKATAMAPVS